MPRFRERSRPKDSWQLPSPFPPTLFGYDLGRARMEQMMRAVVQGQESSQKAARSLRFHRLASSRKADYFLAVGAFSAFHPSGSAVPFAALWSVPFGSRA